MPRHVLGRNTIRLIHKAVGDLFARAKTRFLGRAWGPLQAQVHRPASHRDDLSLPALFDFSTRSEGLEPQEALRDNLSRIASGYLDAAEAKAKVRVVHAVQSWITDAEHKRVKTTPEIVLGGELAEVWRDVSHDVRRIVDSESTKARNVGTLDAVSRMQRMAGQDDPTICFMGPNDAHTCDECKRLFFLPDGRPKVYKMSELKAGYHKRGEAPSMCATHPHCRHTLVGLALGYGFRGPSLEYIEVGWNEWAAQRA